MDDIASASSDGDLYRSMSTNPDIKYRPMPEPLSVYVPLDALTMETVDSVVSTALRFERPDWNNSRRTLLAFLLAINEKVREIENRKDSYNGFDEQTIQHAAQVRNWLVHKDRSGKITKLNWDSLREKYEKLRRETGDTMADKYGINNYEPYYELTLEKVHADVVRSRGYMARFRSQGWEPNELKIYWDIKQLENLCPNSDTDIEPIEEEDGNKNVTEDAKVSLNEEIKSEVTTETISKMESGEGHGVKDATKVDTNQEVKSNSSIESEFTEKEEMKSEATTETKVEEKQEAKDNTKIEANEEAKTEPKGPLESGEGHGVKDATKVDTNQEVKSNSSIESKSTEKEEMKSEATIETKVEEKRETNDNTDTEANEKVKGKIEGEIVSVVKHVVKTDSSVKSKCMANVKSLPPHDPSDADVVQFLRKHPVRNRNNTGRISFVNKGIEAAVFDIPEDAQIIVLNFANERSPGGGYLWHAWAQEEIILYNSDGYRALLDLKYGRMGGGYAIPEFGLAYVRDIRFFQRDTGKDRKTDMLVSACYCLTGSPQLFDNPATFEEWFANNLKKFRAFIAAAAANTRGNGSNTYLLLGPIGTGAFGNDVGEIGTVFLEALKSNMMGSNGPIYKAFEHIWFVSTDKWKNVEFEKIFREGQLMEAE